MIIHGQTHHHYHPFNGSWRPHPAKSALIFLWVTSLQPPVSSTICGFITTVTMVYGIFVAISMSINMVHKYIYHIIHIDIYSSRGFFFNQQASCFGTLGFLGFGKPHGFSCVPTCSSTKESGCPVENHVLNFSMIQISGASCKVYPYNI